jgi:predicted adenine nucleotide alpha hydrolase (AANH) superfamily ATPase
MKILLHMCCSNCAVYPARILRNEGNSLTGFWFNPNIHPVRENALRLNSLKVLADRWHIDMLYDTDYRPETFFEIFNMTLKDAEHAVLNDSFPGYPERCRSCYRLRLEKTADAARKQGFDAFSTTLLISPYQNFEWISECGNEISEKYDVLFYQRDFRPYFRESLAAAKELGLYRQKYCGCVFSKEEREKKKNV